MNEKKRKIKNDAADFEIGSGELHLRPGSGAGCASLTIALSRMLKAVALS
jgi:hypothetical protein